MRGLDGRRLVQVLVQTAGMWEGEGAGRVAARVRCRRGKDGSGVGVGATGTTPEFRGREGGGERVRRLGSKVMPMGRERGRTVRAYRWHLVSARVPGGGTVTKLFTGMGAFALSRSTGGQCLVEPNFFFFCRSIYAFFLERK